MTLQNSPGARPSGTRALPVYQRFWFIALSVVCSLMLLGPGGIAVLRFIDSLDAPDFPRLEAQGDLIVAALERSHATHGSFPPSLAAAGIHPEKTRWGEWEYRISSDGTFKLRVGDYGRDGFTLWWDHEHGWYRDM